MDKRIVIAHELGHALQVFKEGGKISHIDFKKRVCYHKVETIDSKVSIVNVFLAGILYCYKFFNDPLEYNLDNFEQIINKYGGSSDVMRAMKIYFWDLELTKRDMVAKGHYILKEITTKELQFIQYFINNYSHLESIIHDDLMSLFNNEPKRCYLTFLGMQIAP